MTFASRGWSEKLNKHPSHFTRIEERAAALTKLLAKNNFIAFLDKAISLFVEVVGQERYVMDALTLAFKKLLDKGGFVGWLK